MTKIDPQSFVASYSKDLARALEALPAADVAAAWDLLASAHRERRTVFLVGNGGSATTASHMASDLVWGLTRAGIRPMRAIALTDNVATITAIANDTSYADVFAKQLDALASPDDLLIAISASGNSPNVVRCVELAKSLGMKTIGLLGMKGGRVAELTDVKIVVDAADYGPIEDLHMVFDHMTLAYLKGVLAR